LVEKLLQSIAAFAVDWLIVVVVPAVEMLAVPELTTPPVGPAKTILALSTFTANNAASFALLATELLDLIFVVDWVATTPPLAFSLTACQQRCVAFQTIL